MRRYITPGILLYCALIAVVMTGCGKSESTAASNQAAASGKMSPQAEAREQQRVADMAKQYGQQAAQAGARR